MVTGTSYDANGNFFGFVWKNGKMKNLGTLGGAWSQGYAINNKGQITGVGYLANGAAHAFLWTRGKMKDVATNLGPVSWGFGINDNGAVVGQFPFANTYHAFLSTNDKAKDLNKLIPTGSGWVLVSAQGINNSGQIVGEGTHNGQQRAFLLTPQ